MVSGGFVDRFRACRGARGFSVTVRVTCFVSALRDPHNLDEAHTVAGTKEMEAV